MLRQLMVVLKVCLWGMYILAAGRGDLLAFNAHITEDPTKILQKYLSLDKKGVRLEASSWEVMRPFVAWNEEPIWGRVVVISQFEVVDDVSQWEIFDNLEARIPVFFDVLGIMYWENATFVADPHRKTHYFLIKAVQDRWQIAGPQLPPHVGRQRLVDFVHWTALNEPDPVKKSLFQNLQDQMEKPEEKESHK